MLVTNACVPGAPVVVEPIVTVPGAPAGIVKFKIALHPVPVLVTVAAVPGAPVVTVPIVIVGHVQQFELQLLQQLCRHEELQL